MNNRTAAEELARQLSSLGGALHCVHPSVMEHFLMKAEKAIANARAEGFAEAREMAAKAVEEIPREVFFEEGPDYVTDTIRALTPATSEES